VSKANVTVHYCHPTSRNQRNLEIKLLMI